MNLCTPAFQCRAKSIKEQSKCDHYLKSIIEKHENCLTLIPETMKCYSSDARAEVVISDSGGQNE